MRYSILLAIALLLTTACKPVEEMGAARNGPDNPNVIGTLCQGMNDTPFAIIGSDFTRSDFPVSNIMDGSDGTFVTSTTLSSGDSRFIALELDDTTCVTSMRLAEDYTHGEYAWGHLLIWVSEDGVSYDLAVDRQPSLYFAQTNQETYLIDRMVRFVRIEMHYDGFGAWGGSPAFYLGEVYVNGN